MNKFLGKLRFFLLGVIVFAFFFSFVKSQEEEVVVVPLTGTDEEIVNSLYNQGYISNRISYYTLLVISKFSDFEPGAYSIRKGMGALAINAELQNPHYRYVYVQPGLRKEEVAEAFAEALDWTEDEKRKFAENIPMCMLSGGEGYLFPGKYLIHKDENVYVIKDQMQNKLKESIEELVGSPDKSVLNTHQVLTIASLIQREAAGKHDMRLISGVIWNRLFSGTPLQIDATLQYIKGEEGKWWPRVYSDDKYIESPYNTYENKGLPPAPIANPSIAAINAAISPLNTDCLFYIHDNSRNIHCSTTYEGHKQNISYYLK